MNTLGNTPAAGQQWNAGDYARHGRFVADLGVSLLGWLKPATGERILDLGCGDGALTADIAAHGADVIGVDASPELAAAAVARGLDVRLGDGQSLSFESEFDAVFSNAALHWMKRDPDAVLAGVWRALKPGGRFVAEMGGQGNIAAIRTALQAVMAQFGIDAEETAASLYPSPEHYGRLLREAGFAVLSIELVPRPTPLPAGMTSWLNTFRNGVLDLLPAEDRARAVDETVALLQPILADADGNWTGDYVRLRFYAIRNEPGAPGLDL